jgi:hypothetical protein
MPRGGKTWWLSPTFAGGAHLKWSKFNEKPGLCVTMPGLRQRLCGVVSITDIRTPAACLLLLACLSIGCSSKYVIATWSSSQSSDSSTSDAGGSFAFPWSTGFESGFDDYSAGGGSCYANGSASYEIVDTPVHSGQHAAAFTIIADGTMSSTTSRCVREGVLPQQAYYGAWYYVPSANTIIALWNLLHFHGGNSSSDTGLHGLWDVSLAANGTGGLRLSVYEFPLGNAQGNTPDMSGAPAIPIGSWFHIEMFLKRASDATGEVQVYQDGVSALHLAGLVTDDSKWGQWFVGNLAANLNPPTSKVYVDDVTISGEL